MAAKVRVDFGVPPIVVTSFRDQFAKTLTMEAMSLAQLKETIEKTTAISKKDLPWVKLATFGEVPTDKGCLRHDANVLKLHGVEGDYDAGVMSIDEAERRLKAAGVECLLYTGASHTEQTPHWRVLAPMAPVTGGTEALKKARTKFLRRIDGVLGFVLARESYVLSQAYYIGGVGGTADVRLLEGRRIDRMSELDEEADRSKDLMRKVGIDVRDGLVDEDIHKRYRHHPHVLDQGDRKDQFRAIQRCIDKCRGPIAPPTSIVLRSAWDMIVNPSPPPRWLLKPYLEQDVTAVMAGDYGTFKSFLGLDWSLHIATGMKWHGDSRGTIAAQTVVFISAEGRGLLKRIRAWAKYHQVGEAALKSMKFYSIEMAVNLSRADQMSALVAAIDALGVPPALIVVDTLTKNSTGVEESNSNMQAFLNAISAELRLRYFCSVLLVHHVGHSSKDRMRGPISLVGNTEAAFMVYRMGDSLTLHTVRLKDSETPEDFGLRSHVIDLGIDCEGQPESSLVLLASKLTDMRATPKGSRQRDLWNALNTAEDIEYTKNDLWTLAGTVMPVNRVNETIKGLCNSGWLVDRGGRWEFLK